MQYVVKCVDTKRARECAYAVQVLHGPVIYCAQYEETGYNGSIVRPCEH